MDFVNALESLVVFLKVVSLGIIWFHHFEKEVGHIRFSVSLIYSFLPNFLKLGKKKHVDRCYFVICLLGNKTLKCIRINVFKDELIITQFCPQLLARKFLFALYDGRPAVLGQLFTLCWI